MQFIDLSKQQKLISHKIKRRINDVLSHGQYIMGKEIFELEEKLSKYTNSKHCITCSSGTDALLICLMAHRIGPGDAVLTTPFTFFSSSEVISFLGATPIFIDIYDSTYNINPEGIEQGIALAEKKKLKPKAIMPVDLFGIPARYRMISKIAYDNNLFVIEDCAQSFGAQIRGEKAGSFGNVAATSFFPSKPLGCYGDGGAIFTNNSQLADKMRSIRVHGGGNNQYENIQIGLNGRFDTLQAAILLEKLAIFDNELRLRNKIAKYYVDNINKLYSLPYVPRDYKSSWAQFSILSKNEKHRESIMKHLALNDIPCMIYYPTPLHLQKVYKSLGYKKGSFPIAEKISKTIFSIPMHPYLKKEDQDKIISKLNEII